MECCTLSLPTELIVRILSFLSHDDLDACTFACNELADIIEGTSSLSYILELGVTGLQDCGARDVTYPELLDILRTREHAWSTLNWRATWKIPVIEAYMFWELCGSAFFGTRLTGGPAPSHGVGFNTIDFYDLQEPTAVEPMQISFEKTFLNFGVDPGQNLVILLEFSETGSSPVWLLHVRAFSTGLRHPKADVETIRVPVAHEQWSSPNGFPGNTDIQIIGSILLFAQRRGPGCSGSISIINWKKGARIFTTYPVLGSWACSLLSETEILIAWRTSFVKQTTLEYYELVSESKKKWRSTSFELPFRDAERMWKPNYCYGQASFTFTEDSIIQPETYPFIHQPTPRIVAFRFYHDSFTPPNTARKIDMFLMVDNLRRFKTFGDTVPWDIWGPESTRIFSEVLPKMWQRVIRGFRAILPGSATILDFNEGLWGEGDEGVVTESSTISLDPEGKFRVTSGLPYKQMRLSYPSDCRTPMLGDTIICAAEDLNERGRLKALRVLRF
ncbi:hypothetical protein M422DRAFT_262455 [Sphaerobolus stellatus SS14]|uniref:F-box domain-containing protein n=1 Tax=Sphaerobolus stellatus (strain SS14) TaxID=990650 RepID=A0A0C9UK97_SPHS4|nr:hypothetical protein M422DRAFT_262455 [Sphaerobolus stellatus SS14]